uniref:Uncharacterized protein n=2 Tax=Ciona intestinalis TaxID=7719 RepID=F6T7G8_CIOIN
RQRSNTDVDRILDDVISPTRFTLPKDTTRQNNRNDGPKLKRSATVGTVEHTKQSSHSPKPVASNSEWNSVNIVEDNVFAAATPPVKKRGSASKLDLSRDKVTSKPPKAKTPSKSESFRVKTKSSESCVVTSDATLAPKTVVSPNSVSRAKKPLWEDLKQTDLVIVEKDSLGTSPTLRQDIYSEPAKRSTPIKQKSGENDTKFEPNFSSGEPKFSTKRNRKENIADTDINYSAEEAIDTFRRLSEEIDSIKERGFRP